MSRCLNLMSVGLLSLATILCGNTASADVENPSEADTDRAREFMREGIASFEHHQWQQAYEAFSSAWELKHHFSILGNLAYAEFKVGKLVDGEEHLRQYFALLPPNRSKERKLAEARFAEIRAELVALTIGVNVDGSEVFVNGIRVGQSPLGHEVFVNPGTVALEARHSGYETASATITASKADARSVNLALTQSLNVNAASQAEKPASPVANSAPVPPLHDYTVDANPKSIPDDRGTAAPPTKKIVLGVGIGLTGVAVGLGTFFSIKTLNARSDERDLQSTVDRQYPLACAVAPGAGSGECTRLSTRGNDRADALTASRVAFAFAAGLGVATGLIYWAIPNTKERPAKASIWATPTSGGFVVDGCL